MDTMCAPNGTSSAETGNLTIRVTPGPGNNVNVEILNDGQVVDAKTFNPDNLGERFKIAKRNNLPMSAITDAINTAGPYTAFDADAHADSVVFRDVARHAAAEG